MQHFRQPAGAIWIPIRLRQYLDPERVIDLCDAAYNRRIALTEQEVLPMIDGWFVLLILSLASSIGGLVPLLEAESTASDGG